MRAASMKRYACWRPERIDAVMETDALQPSPAVFAATHYPLRMYKRTRLELESARVPYDEQTFRRDFLDPAKGYTFVPVLGPSGTGKSHLIRWLHAHIPQTPNRRVLLIPKVDTNLRDVLLKILALDGLEGAAFEQLRQRVRDSAGHLTVERAKELLLANLAVAVGPNGEHKKSDLKPEMRKALSTYLPPLLNDPFFREFFLAKDGVLHALAERSIGAPKPGESREERLQFRKEHLPLELNIARIANGASAKAKEAHRNLCATPALVEPTVRWLNDHLEQAINGVLNLGRDLKTVMRDVRVVMEQKRIELVVLIEDFALLQGIDTQLLDALLVEPRVENGPQLCRMRVALGCTTEYFRPLFETVQTRAQAHFFVDLHLDLTAAARDGLLRQEDPIGLAARYLNAVRLGVGELDAWHAEAAADKADDLAAATADLPNPCKSCVHRQRCFDGFGESAGIGLYPFNRDALTEMMRRTMKGEQFNVRSLIREVLHRTLKDHGPAVLKGEFPPAALHQQFGGTYRPGFGPLVQQAVRKRDPANAERRKVLLDLWSTTEQVADLHEVVHEAFDLPRLRDVPVVEEGREASKTTAAKDESLTPPPVPGLPSDLQELCKRISDWSAQKYRFTQDDVNTLRGLVLDAVDGWIDWDAELMLRGHFVGAGKPLMPRGINFPEGMIPAEGSAPVRINIPDSAAGESREALAVVLDGLVRFRFHKDWKFPEGGNYLRQVARQVSAWGERVLVQLRTPMPSARTFDPVAAAVELLAIGQVLCGRAVLSPGAVGDPAAALDALFLPPATEPMIGNRSEPWRQLVGAFGQHQEKLLEIAVERSCCTKGGSRKIQVLDATRWAMPLTRVGASGRPTEVVPDGCANPGPFQALHQFRKKVDELLAPALKQEQARYAAWLENVRTHLGPDASIKPAIDLAHQASREAHNLGVGAGATPQEIEHLAQPLRPAEFARVVRVVESAAASPPNERATQLALLSQPIGGVMEAASRFLDEADRLLTRSSQRLEEKIRDLGKGVDLDEVCGAIDRNFVLLEQYLEELE